MAFINYCFPFCYNLTTVSPMLINCCNQQLHYCFWYDMFGGKRKFDPDNLVPVIGLNWSGILSLSPYLIIIWTTRIRLQPGVRCSSWLFRHYHTDHTLRFPGSKDLQSQLVCSQIHSVFASFFKYFIWSWLIRRLFLAHYHMPKTHIFNKHGIGRGICQIGKKPDS